MSLNGILPQERQKQFPSKILLTLCKRHETEINSF
jgi:hypothetical protein